MIQKSAAMFGCELIDHKLKNVYYGGRCVELGVKVISCAVADEMRIVV